MVSFLLRFVLLAQRQLVDLAEVGAGEVGEDEDADREKKEISVREEELQGYAGDYWSEELGATYRLAIANGKAHKRAGDQPFHPTTVELLRRLGATE